MGGRGRGQNGFNNPQVSQQVHLFPQDWENAMNSKLREFERSNNPTLDLPPMERKERKRIHEIVRYFSGLHCQSSGREPFRQCHITRRRMNMMTAVTAHETSPITLTPEQKKTIRDYIQKNPISSEDVTAYLSIVPGSKQGGRDGQGIGRGANMIYPPNTDCSPDMLRQRHQLPAYSQRTEILEAIAKHQVVLITGGTGCGKTTQVPQFLLEDAYHTRRPIRIVCTQPRRLPAIAVAERVARERNEKVGNTVGYHIRLEQKTTASTVLTYCTSGVLLRMLTQDDIAKDVSHIILDEIHEREQNTDYLLIALKQALKKRDNLKIILMSATMEGNLKMFMEYFGDHVHVKHIDIPSRLFYVEKFHLGEVLAMTGYQPPKSAFSGVWGNSASSFEVSTWDKAVNNGMGNSSAGGFGNNSANNNSFVSGQVEKKDWEAWTVSAPQMHEIQTAPNLQSMSSYSNNMASNDASSHNLFNNVAQQIANSNAGGQSGFGMQQSSSHIQNSGAQQYQQQFIAGPYSQPPPSMQRLQQYNHPPPPASSASLQHSATWGARLDQPDVVDMPLDPENVEQFKQLLCSGPEQYGNQVHSQPMVDNNQMNWQHTQSQNQMSVGWESGSNLYHAQPIEHIPQRTGFYVPQDDGGTGTQFGYFTAPMDGRVGAPIVYPNSSPQQQLHHNNPMPHSVSMGQMPASGECEFGASIRRQDEENESMRHQLSSALPGRPMAFDKDIRKLLQQRMKTDPANLVKMYLHASNREYQDGVDVDLVVGVVKYCVESNERGAILVFLPGYDDITQVRDRLQSETYRGKPHPQIYTLHSQMNSGDQQRVFEVSKDRKVILSTNIAEASLTIDDVVFVVDCGKVKEKTYDHTSRISQLKVEWIAKSNAEQRSGRAGRCQAGYCFRLYSTEDYDNMLITQRAEMQRAAIHDVCLHAKMFAPENLSVKDFLALAPEPPGAEAIENSMKFLEQLGAVYSESSTSDEDMHSCRSKEEPLLTDLGRLIAQLPLDPQLARLLLFGLTLKCLHPVVTLVAALSHRDPFIIANSDEREKANIAREKFAHNDFSDHIALLRAINEFETTGAKNSSLFCKNAYLSLSAMRMIQGIRRQLLVELRRVRMIDYEGDPTNALKNPNYNMHGESWPMVQAAIVAGCYPGIGFVRNGNKMKKIRTCLADSATLHPSSVIKRQVMNASKKNVFTYTTAEAPQPELEFLAFQELAKIDEGLTLRTVTVVPPVAIVLFAGAIRLRKTVVNFFNIVQDTDDFDEEAEEANIPRENEMGFAQNDILELEDWIAVRGPFESIQRLVQLRFKIMSYFLAVTKNPRIIGQDNKDHKDLLEVLKQVLEVDHKERHFVPVRIVEPSYRSYSSYGQSTGYAAANRYTQNTSYVSHRPTNAASSTNNPPSQNPQVQKAIITPDVSKNEQEQKRRQQEHERQQKEEHEREQERQKLEEQENQRKEQEKRQEERKRRELEEQKAKDMQQQKSSQQQPVSSSTPRKHDQQRSNNRYVSSDVRMSSSSVSNVNRGSKPSRKDTFDNDNRDEVAFKPKGFGPSSYRPKDNFGRAGYGGSFSSRNQNNHRGFYSNEGNNRSSRNDSFTQENKDRHNQSDASNYGSRDHNQSYNSTSRQGRDESFREGGGSMYADKIEPRRQRQASYRGGPDHPNERRRDGSNGDYNEDWNDERQYVRDNRGEQYDCRREQYDDSGEQYDNRGEQYDNRDERYDNRTEQYGSRPGGVGGNNRSPKDQMTWQQQGTSSTGNGGNRGRGFGFKAHRQDGQGYSGNGGRRMNNSRDDCYDDVVPEDPKVVDESDNWEQDSPHKGFDCANHQFGRFREESCGGGGKPYRDGGGYSKGSSDSYNTKNYRGNNSRRDKYDGNTSQRSDSDHRGQRDNSFGKTTWFPSNNKSGFGSRK